MKRLLPTLLLAAAGCAKAAADTQPATMYDRAAAAIGGYIAAEEPRTELLAHLSRTAGDVADRLAKLDAGSHGSIQSLLYANVAANVEAKLADENADGMPLPLTTDELRRTVIDYEAFKLENYVRSGVFPKRYFGYFDGKWDTAAHEATLIDTVRRAVTFINREQQHRGSPVRLSHAEVAVTFIAEGGALLLGEKQAWLDDVHPVRGVGLDDIATGFDKQAKLIRALDRAFGTGLGGIVTWQVSEGERRPYLTRNMTFREAILGTAAMYVFEKEIAHAKLKAAGRPGIDEHDHDDQMIISSLVYNSGILFAADRIRMIRRFETGAYLARVSRQNAKRRWPLPVAPPKQALQQLLVTVKYPEQPTSWAAVYHVLQRYGGYTALQRQGGVFDADGSFTRLAKP